jgi:hypothetical protein
MKNWKEIQMEVRRVKPDREMAESIYKMIKIRLDEVIKRTKEAVSLYLKSSVELPKEKFVGIQKIAV